MDMISIIICSRKKSINANLDANIKKTIGCDYELIIIDNSENKYSIFEAYNKGIKDSKGEYLCFMHDDVLIHTNDWGKIINRIFQEDSQIGLIGVAGSKIKTKMPSAWWRCDLDQQVIHIIQHSKNSEKEKVYLGFKDELMEEVVVIDGVFMVARKDPKIYFNKKMSGFHNYDLNISLEYLLNKYKIIISNEILIEHFSIGEINKIWCNSALEFYKLYGKYLPLTSEESLSKKQLKALEFSNGIAFISDLLKYSYYYQSSKFWIKLIFIKPISGYHLLYLKNIFKV